MNDLDYLLNQLNLLIGFLDVSDEQVYESIKHHDHFNMGMTIEQLYNKEFSNYKNHITTSALLLGFTHFEDYLTKSIVNYLMINPDKNEFKVNLKVIREQGDNLVKKLAEEQSRKLQFVEKVRLI